MTKADDRAEFLATMVQEFGELVGSVNAVRYALEFMVLAHKAHRYNLLRCNTELTPRQEALEARVDARVAALGHALGTAIRTEGDPRGFALKILLPSGAYNTWGGKEYGYGIPS